MWIASHYGFFSIVQKRGDRRGSWQVRARSRADLQRLCRALYRAKHAIRTRIVDTPEGDYPCRIFLNKRELNCVMLLLATTVRYPNFKDHIKASRSQKDKLAAYTAVWMRMREWQLDEEDYSDPRYPPYIHMQTHDNTR